MSETRTLSPEDSKALIELLESESEPTDALVLAMARYRDVVEEDGFGGAVSIWCDECELPTVGWVRPGDARCMRCE